MNHAQRNAETEASIKAAFITLLEAKPFNKITIANIASHAKISRGTFYVHYPDKYALLEKIEADILNQIKIAVTIPHPDKHQVNLADLTSETYLIFTDCLHYLDSERTTLQALLSQNGDPQFFDQIKKVVAVLFEENLAMHHGHFSTTLPIYYTKEIAINNLINLVRHWLNHPDPETPSEFAKILLLSRAIAPQELMVFD